MLELTEAVFLQVKRQELYKNEIKKNANLWNDVNSSTVEAFNNFVTECSNKSEKMLSKWKAEFPPSVWYQASKGNVYAEDDEVFLDFDMAIETVRENADYDDIYVIWANEKNTLPYPVVLIFDKKMFIEPLVAVG